METYEHPLNTGDGMWGYPFKTFEYWADLAEKTPDFLIDNLLHSATNSVSGKPTVGKTRLVAAVAAAVANDDEEFCGRKINDHGPVMVISTDAGETRKWGMRMREHRVKPGRVGVAKFNPSHWDLYKEQAKHSKLFVVDNLTGILGGGSIGDDAVARSLLQPLADIAELGTTVLLIAHSAKNFEANTGKYTPTGVMGSTVYQAWERLNIHIHDVTEPNTRHLQIKSNDAATQNVSITADWGRASATWRMLKEHEDARPRTEETFERRLDLFEEVANDSELSKVKGINEMGRQLHNRFPDRWEKWEAAKQAFTRAKKSAGGEYTNGRWQVMTS